MKQEQERDIAAARRFLERKRAREREENRKLWEQAWRDAEAIVAMLIRKYNPRRIYQWGSVLRREHFTQRSDIDIAVEGVGKAERFFAMYGDAAAMTRFPLDLVEMEKIAPEFADIIRMKGKIVYERADRPD